MDALTDRQACIIMNLTKGLGPQRMNTLVQAFGSAAAVFEQDPQTLRLHCKIPAETVAALLNWKEEAHFDEEMESVRRAGARVVTRYDEEYPDVLRPYPDAPICLYVKGTLPEDLSARALAVVGTRHITRYGREMTEHLSQAAVLAGWAIISGMAAGVDAVAHESAINLGGVTIGVLGGGLGRIYPQEHVPLARRAVESGGAIISEFPMLMPPNRRTFPMRNRIVAMLSRGVLVVEAGANSGALITANLGVEYGKNIFAVPGQVDNPLSAGCHKLIKQGAKLVENFNDVAEEYEFLPGFAEKVDTLRENGEGTYKVGDIALSADESTVLEALGEHGAMNLDELTVQTALPTGPLLAALMQLEIKRKIKPGIGGKYARN